MITRADNESARRRAFGNLLRAVDVQKRMPMNVFFGTWAKFLFFESDRIANAKFVEVVAQLLTAENATIGGLLNVFETKSFVFEHIAALFLDKATTGIDYMACLRGTSPAVGWLYSMGTYACASDVGEWCIYCERDNDIAIIGLRDNDGVAKFKAPLEELSAGSIEALEASGFFPFNKLIPTWRKGLIENYVGQGDKV
jgi:hypothetical protein